MRIRVQPLLCSCLFSICCAHACSVSHWFPHVLTLFPHSWSSPAVCAHLFTPLQTRYHFLFSTPGPTLFQTCVRAVSSHKYVNEFSLHSSRFFFSFCPCPHGFKRFCNTFPHVFGTCSESFLLLIQKFTLLLFMFHPYFNLSLIIWCLELGSVGRALEVGEEHRCFWRQCETSIEGTCGDRGSVEPKIGRSRRSKAFRIQKRGSSS